ncbi:MAG: Kelch repeat-containing protein, partial [Thermoplasmatota archaeon]
MFSLVKRNSRLVCTFIIAFLLTGGLIWIVSSPARAAVQAPPDLSGPWIPMAGIPWKPRSSHASVVLPDDSIVLMGGYDGIDRMNDVWRSTDGGDTWTQMTDAAEWAARSGHTSVVLSDGSVVLMGGYDGSNPLNDVWRSTDKGATWTQITASASWSARSSHTSVALSDDSIVLMLGSSETSSFMNDVWRSTDMGATWTQMTASAFSSGRNSHTSVALSDDSILIIGGFYYVGGDIPHLATTGRVYRSDDMGATWTLQGTVSPTYNAAAVVLSDDTVLVMGGYFYSYVVGTSYRSDNIYQSDDAGETWTEINSNPEWPELESHSVVALADDSLVLTGGYTGSKRLNDIWQSTDGGLTWVDVEGVEWSERGGPGAEVLADGSILVMGGNPGSISRLNDVWRSTNMGATWITMTDQAAWDGRFSFGSVVLPDNSIVIMGGYFRKNDVWRSTDMGTTWISMTMAAEWSGRHYFPSVVLSDGSILIMGGYGTTSFNDVWRSTDMGATWITMTNAAEWSV